jgi:hypothetical protein
MRRHGRWMYERKNREDKERSGEMQVRKPML